jgi:feruloyl-CoA synthase
MTIERARPETAPAARARDGDIFAPPLVDLERRADGAMILRSPAPLRTLPSSLCVLLERWAHDAPERVFLAERAEAPAGADWRTLTYRDAHARARSVAQALSDRKLDAARPILILAENGIDHALMMLGAMLAGIPVAPVSTAYARLSRDFAKLAYVAGMIRPQLVYVDDPARYRDALRAVTFPGAEMVTSRPSSDFAGTAFAEIAATPATAVVDRAQARIGPDTVVKVLFTSGSTGVPKGVVNTHRMLCANQESMAQIWPFVEREPPIIVDWLPWNHTFGGNHNFNLVLRNGGTLYIDAGKPAPALFAPTIANLRAVAPTLYFNVPRGYAALLDQLEVDAGFNRHFFSRLCFVFYAAAALSQPQWRRLEACSLRARGEIVPMISAWGLTETAPMVTSGHYAVDRAGVIGLPAPGNELMLKPVGDRLEMLVRGPVVTPGYWQRPDLTAQAFEHGWFKTGDAARFADPGDPAKGIVFDGRVAENFKLSTGTWVNVGMLRVAVLGAASPLFDDAVVTGHDRDEIGLLAFPNLAACRALCPELGPDAPTVDILAHNAVRAAVAAAVARHNAQAMGSSTRICRVIMLADPPSSDANESTDKGYINQRAVLERRADLVERLYADPLDAAAIVIGQPDPNEKACE